MKRLLSLAVLFISLLVLCTSCDEKNKKPIEIDPILLESLVLDAPSSIEFTEGDPTQTFQVYFLPKGAEVKNFKISSSDPSVVDVEYKLIWGSSSQSATGADITIRPVGAGKAEILVDVEGKTANISVIVNAKEVTPPPTPENPTITSDEYIEIYYNEASGLQRAIRLATKNIGASSSTEVGSFFAFGDYEEKDDYSSNDSSHEGGYILRPYEDAATVLWGNEWRMPSSGELKFIKACASVYSIDGVEGRLIEGHDGKFTFMPAGGYKIKKEHNELNVSMGYWGNSVSYGNTSYASSWYSLATAFNGEVIVGDLLDTQSLRAQGMNVRPVKRPNTKIGSIEASSVSPYSATLSASVDLADLLESDIESVFFEISTDSRHYTVVEANYSSGVISGDLTDLYSGINYTVFAVIKTAVDGYYYSEKFIFDTENVDEEQAVDMGVSVLWAGWNLGSTKSSEPGDLYSWGEISSRGNNSDDYTYKNNKFSNGQEYGNIPYRKYNENDQKSVLEPEDDAATVLLGADWHIPTIEEWIELIDNCDSQFVYRDGVLGRLFISKINGKSLFFPYYDHGNHYYCAYWTSSIRLNIRDWEKRQNEYHYEYAYCAWLNNDYISTDNISRRYNAYPIRAVKVKKN